MLDLMQRLVLEKWTKTPIGQRFMWKVRGRGPFGTRPDFKWERLPGDLKQHIEDIKNYGSLWSDVEQYLNEKEEREMVWASESMEKTARSPIQCQNAVTSAADGVMNKQAVAKELVAVAREIQAGIYDTSTLVVGIGDKPIDPSTGKPLEELGFIPKVEFSIITKGTTRGLGQISRATYRTDLHFTQYSPDRRYYWGRDATTSASIGNYGPLLYTPKHWDDYSAQYLQRIEKALQYHFPVTRGTRSRRIFPPYLTWVEYIRKPLISFGDSEDFISGDVRDIFKVLRGAVTS